MQSLGTVDSSSRSSSTGTPTTAFPQPLFCLSCSTLDPVLRGEVHGFDWKAFLVLATASLYFFATPGAKHPSSNWHWKFAVAHHVGDESSPSN
jgi:hypothetical protein